MKVRIIASRHSLRPWLVGTGAALLLAAFTTDAMSSQSLLVQHVAEMHQRDAAVAIQIVPSGDDQRGRHRSDFFALLDAADPLGDAW